MCASKGLVGGARSGGSGLGLLAELFPQKDFSSFFLSFADYVLRLFCSALCLLIRMNEKEWLL